MTEILSSHNQIIDTRLQPCGFCGKRGHYPGEWHEADEWYVWDRFLDLAYAENEMTARQRKDQWMRVRYWAGYIAAGAPKNYQWGDMGSRGTMDGCPF